MRSLILRVRQRHLFLTNLLEYFFRHVCLQEAVDPIADPVVLTRKVDPTYQCGLHGLPGDLP